MALSSDHSAGILLYRSDVSGSLEVFIGHMGGPFWAHKDAGAWSIPKGLAEPGEELLAAALREFREETGHDAPVLDYTVLGDFRYTSGKLVTVFAARGDFDVAQFSSNLFSIEWPRGSGQLQQFPELDRAGWFGIDEARTKLVKGQAPVMDALASLVAS